jgi:hypothetical protein
MLKLSFRREPWRLRQFRSSQRLPASTAAATYTENAAAVTTYVMSVLTTTATDSLTP